MTAPQTLSNTPQLCTEPLTLHCGNNAEVLRSYPDCHFDAIITDPPYGIEFLGKDWDNHTGAIATWRECFRVLKPGGYLLAFSAARTYHNLATNIESVGFEIRDQLMWIYSSGFPKAQDVGKNIAKQQLNKKNMSLPQQQWSQLKLIQGSGSTGSIYQHPNGKKYRQLRNTKTQRAAAQYGGHAWTDTYEEVLEHHNQWSGWKTALKPAHEPIVMARRPFKGSTKDNVLTHGVGALNIDVTRIPFEDAADYKSSLGFNSKYAGIVGDGGPLFQGQDAADRKKDQKRVIRAGRDPRNRLKDLETQTTPADHNHEETPVYEANPQGRYPSNVMGDIPDYQKYFYCPKVSRKERHVGFEQSGNNHPTVKPVALMRYLIQLVTPVNSIVLDPFMGSGSTGMAARELGHTFVGIDLDPAYVEIAQKRITGWCRTETTRSVQPETSTDLKHTDLFDDLFE